MLYFSLGYSLHVLLPLGYSLHALPPFGYSLRVSAPLVGDIVSTLVLKQFTALTHVNYTRSKL